MAELARAEVKLIGDDANLHRALAGAEKQMNTVGRSLQRTGDKIRKKFTTLEDSTLSLRRGFAVLAGATGMGLVAKRLFEMGAAVDETANKFNVVMGDAAGQARARLEELTDTIPLLQSEMERMAAGIQDMLVPLGVARTDAAGMSVEMVKLAGDLASFNNVAADVPLEAIQSALAGMSRPLRQFGVDVSQTRLETLALNEGLIEQGQELNNAARAQAVLIAASRDSADAMGDAARTADSAANMMRFLQRDVRQAAESISKALVPAMQVIVDKMIAGTSRLDGFTETLQNQAPVVAAWANFVVEAFQFATRAIAAPIRVAFNLGQVLGNLGRVIGLALTGRFREAADASEDMIGDMLDIEMTVRGIIGSFDDMRIESGKAFSTVATSAQQASQDVNTALNVSPEGGTSGSVISNVTSEIQTLGRVADVDLTEAFKTATKTFQDAGSVGVSVARSVGENFLNAFGAIVSSTQSAAEAFSSLAKSILADLSRMIARAAVFAAITSAFSLGTGDFGSAFTSLLGGGGIPGLAHGGAVSAGRPHIVGEQGPEVFVPSSAGNIVPNNQMGGMANVSRAILDAAGPPPRVGPPSTIERDAWWREVHKRLGRVTSELSG